MQLRVASLVMSAGADAPRRAGDAACETGRLASFAFALLSEMTVTRLLAEMDARMHARDFEECENVALCVFYLADTQEPRAAAAQCLAALHNLLFADFHAARVFYEMALLHMPAVGEHVDAGINADRIKVLVQYGRMLERRLRLHTDALRCFEEVLALCPSTSDTAVMAAIHAARIHELRLDQPAIAASILGVTWPHTQGDQSPSKQQVPKSSTKRPRRSLSGGTEHAWLLFWRIHFCHRHSIPCHVPPVTRHQLDSHTDTSGSLLHSAIWCEDRGEIAHALDLYRLALASNGDLDMSVVHFEYAACLASYHHADTAQALQHLNAAVADDPHFQAARSLRALLLLSV